MIPFGIPLQVWAAGAFVLAVGGYVLHCEHTKEDYKDFVATLKAEQKTAQRVTQIETDRTARLKETTDASYKAALARLAADNNRLRYERARSGLVPAAGPASRRPDLACFEREQLRTALSKFEDGVAGLFERCDEGAIALETAKAWAKER